MTLVSAACALATGLAVGYAVEEGRRLASGRLFRLVGRAQSVRRILGSLIVAVVMVLVYFGLEVIDPYARPRQYVWLWGVVALSVVLLCGLAALDLRELRANRDLERARELQRFGEELQARDAGARPGPGSGSRDIPGGPTRPPGSTTG